MHVEIGHAHVETRNLKALASVSEVLDILKAKIDGVSARFKACRRNALKHSYAATCRKRLHVGVRAKNASGRFCVSASIWHL